MANEELQSFKYPTYGGQGELAADACGKTILVGEHPVLYGACAVALPLKAMRLSLWFKGGPRTEKMHITIKMEGLKGSALSSVIVVTEQAAQLLDVPPQVLEVKGRSCLPLGAGFGSSAALCVAILRGLTQLSARVISDTRLAELANELEKRFHGNPSGLDVATISFEYPIRFRRGSEPESLGMAPGSRWPFVLIDSGLKACTKVMIQIARPYFEGEAGARRVSRFDRLASRVEAGLRLGDVSLVADAMNTASTMLGESGVVNGCLRDIIDSCLEMGCLAAKVTGAGGGGAVLALLDPASEAQQRKKLEEVYGAAAVYEVGL